MKVLRCKGSAEIKPKLLIYIALVSLSFENETDEMNENEEWRYLWHQLHSFLVNGVQRIVEEMQFSGFIWRENYAASFNPSWFLIAVISFAYIGYS